MRYLKWNNDIVGIIDGSNAIKFTALDYNEVVLLYTKGAPSWTPTIQRIFIRAYSKP